MPSSEQVRQYQQATRNLAENAGLALKRQLRAYLGENPGATVAEAREYAKEAAAGVVTEFSQASTVLAEELYAAEFGSLPSGYIEAAVNADEVDAVVRYRVCDLVDGDVDGFVEGMGEWVAQASFNACNERTLQLARGKKSKAQMQRERRARRKSEHTTWFARVPSGVNTCTWCAMLAGRGYVYWTEETAGEFSKWHDNCRCTVVATTKKGGIEGYDPSSWIYLSEVYEALDASGLPTAQRQAIRNLLSMYDIEDFKAAGGCKTLFSQYAKCAETVGLDLSASSKEDVEAIFAEASKRDVKWLLSGESSSTDYSENPLSAYGRLKAAGDYSPENIVDRGNEWRDLWAHHVLEENGITATTHAAKDIDLTIGGEWWEVKSPEMPSTKPKEGRELAFIESELRKASKQFKKRGIDSAKVVFSARYRQVASDAEMVSELKTRMTMHHIDEVLYITSAGGVIRL